MLRGKGVLQEKEMLRGENLLWEKKMPRNKCSSDKKMPQEKNALGKKGCSGEQKGRSEEEEKKIGAPAVHMELLSEAQQVKSLSRP